ncbi:MAG: hypothetical protein ABIO39_03850 [Caulobacteraceae bacterium]
MATAPAQAIATYPRLAPIEAEPLAAFAEIPAHVMAMAGSPPAWAPLIEPLRKANDTQPMLLRSLVWGLAQPDRLWWACLSARLEEILSARTTRSQSLILAERWVREGDDAVRYEAFHRSRDESAMGAAPLVGLAAFVSGASLAPQGAPVEEPPADLARSSTLSALLVAAGAKPLGDKGFERVNAIGLDIAAGGDGREAARHALNAASGGPQSS